MPPATSFDLNGACVATRSQLLRLLPEQEQGSYYPQQKVSAAEFSVTENHFGVTRVSVRRMVDGISN